MNREVIRKAWAGALFASSISAFAPVDHDTIDAAIRTTFKRLHVRGCAEFVAREYGDHPDTAVMRMRWAILTIAALYPALCECPAPADAKKTLIGADQ